MLENLQHFFFKKYEKISDLFFRFRNISYIYNVNENE